ncbi:hypothetical protein NDU88_003997 [Pleurodeles waltl]|uniref:Uncharacterized protein n=1 Tax=Pleurodeles waltl TaxID=8319 RepID=A0AAV7LK33_PLEWA|nr:hypothetical protein NDU88_003997 [Pleurodeles waltl]
MSQAASRKSFPTVSLLPGSLWSLLAPETDWLLWPDHYRPEAASELRTAGQTATEERTAQRMIGAACQPKTAAPFDCCGTCSSHRSSKFGCITWAWVEASEETVFRGGWEQPPFPYQPTCLLEPGGPRSFFKQQPSMGEVDTGGLWGRLLAAALSSWGFTVRAD